MLSDCRRLNGTDSSGIIIVFYIYIIISRLSIFQRLERGQRGEVRKGQHEIRLAINYR